MNNLWMGVKRHRN